MVKARADAASRRGPQWLHAAIDLYGVALSSPSSQQVRVIGSNMVRIALTLTLTLTLTLNLTLP